MKSFILFCAIIAMTTAVDYYPVKLNNLGCWLDKANRAIATLEGTDQRLDGPYQHRVLAVQKCAQVAHDHGWDVFAVQNGGWCASAATARQTYRRYGGSSACKVDGEGGPWANQVYEIVALAKVTLQPLGCWRDTSNRAIPTLENLHSVLDGQYHTRHSAIAKCVQASFSSGYKVMALQNGGWCAASRDADVTYKKYGKSTACRSGGKGGPWANQVYRLKVHYVKKYY